MTSVFLVALTIDVPSVVSDTQANLDIIEETGCAFTFPPLFSGQAGSISVTNIRLPGSHDVSHPKMLDSGR